MDIKKIKDSLKLVIKIFKKNNYKNIKLSQKQKILFFEWLYNLVDSWIPLSKAINILFFQTKDKNIKKIIEIVNKDISKGMKLQDSLSWFRKSFSNFDIYIIKMWDVTWKLANSFDTIKTREEKNNEIKSKIIWSMIYPAIIITLSIIMIIWFITFVIPRVQKMYFDARVNLPSLTQKVIDISTYLQKNYITIISILIWIIILIIFLKKNKKTKIYFDKYILKIPIFWKLIKKKILNIFSNTLWILMSNWIAIQEALDISKNSIENAYYEKKIDYIIKKIWEWIPLSDLMGIKEIEKENPFFPIELASAVKIWEQTWKMPSLLIKISNKFERDIDSIVKNLFTIIEPLVIIIVWWIVWTLVMAILLPFFNMAKVL